MDSSSRWIAAGHVLAKKKKIQENIIKFMVFIGFYIVFLQDTLRKRRGGKAAASFRKRGEGGTGKKTTNVHPGS